MNLPPNEGVMDWSRLFRLFDIHEKNNFNGKVILELRDEPDALGKAAKAKEYLESLKIKK